jgi:hypothetical protein
VSADAESAHATAKADRAAVKAAQIQRRREKQYGEWGKQIMEFLEEQGVDKVFWSQVLEYAYMNPSHREEPEKICQLLKIPGFTGGDEPAAETDNAAGGGSGASQTHGHITPTTDAEAEQFFQKALAESMMLGKPQQDHRASGEFEEYYKKKGLSPQEVNKMVVDLQMMTGMTLTEAQAQESLLAADFNLNTAINHYYGGQGGGAKNRRKTNTRRKKKKRLNKKKRSKKKRSKKKRSKKKSNKSRR